MPGHCKKYILTAPDPPVTYDSDCTCCLACEDQLFEVYNPVSLLFGDPELVWAVAPDTTLVAPPCENLDDAYDAFTWRGETYYLGGVVEWIFEGWSGTDCELVGTAAQVASDSTNTYALECTEEDAEPFEEPEDCGLFTVKAPIPPTTTRSCSVCVESSTCYWFKAVKSGGEWSVTNEFEASGNLYPLANASGGTCSTGWQSQYPCGPEDDEESVMCNESNPDIRWGTYCMELDYEPHSACSPHPPCEYPWWMWEFNCAGNNWMGGWPVVDVPPSDVPVDWRYTPPPGSGYAYTGDGVLYNAAEDSTGQPPENFNPCCWYAFWTQQDGDKSWWPPSYDFGWWDPEQSPFGPHYIEEYTEETWWPDPFPDVRCMAWWITACEFWPPTTPAPPTDCPCCDQSLLPDDDAWFISPPDSPVLFYTLLEACDECVPGEVISVTDPSNGWVYYTCQPAYDAGEGPRLEVNWEGADGCVWAVEEPIAAGNSGAGHISIPNAVYICSDLASPLIAPNCSPKVMLCCSDCETELDLLLDFDAVEEYYTFKDEAAWWEPFGGVWTDPVTACAECTGGSEHFIYSFVWNAVTYYACDELLSEVTWVVLPWAGLVANDNACDADYLGSTGSGGTVSYNLSVNNNGDIDSCKTYTIKAPVSSAIIPIEIDCSI